MLSGCRWPAASSAAAWSRSRPRQAGRFVASSVGSRPAGSSPPQPMTGPQVRFCRFSLLVRVGPSWLRYSAGQLAGGWMKSAAQTLAASMHLDQAVRVVAVRGTIFSMRPFSSQTICSRWCRSPPRRACSRDLEQRGTPRAGLQQVRHQLPRVASAPPFLGFQHRRHLGVGEARACEAASPLDRTGKHGSRLRRPRSCRRPSPGGRSTSGFSEHRPLTASPAASGSRAAVTPRGALVGVFVDRAARPHVVAHVGDGDDQRHRQQALPRSPWSASQYRVVEVAMRLRRRW